MLDKQKLADVNRSFKAYFLEALGQASRWSDMITDRVTMSKGELRLKFAARTTGVREWLDERAKNKLRAYDFSLVAKKWENGIQVDGADLEDDDNGLSFYRMAIAELADDFVEHKHQLIIDRLNSGFAGSQGLAYDGQFFFDTDHQDYPGGPTQSNVTNAALSDVSFKAGRTAMRGIKKPNGMIANLNPTHIIVPKELEGAAEDLFNREYTASGGAGGISNTIYKAVQIVVEPRLTSTTAWFLLDATKPLKPFIFGDRRTVGIRSKTDPNGETAFDRDQYEWGGDGRYNAQYGFWHLMYGSTGA